jgi:inosose dehydratase
VSGFSRTEADTASMRVGYAAITWGGDDERAAREIAEAGFSAIQVRGSAFERYGKSPNELKDLLAQHKLTFAVLSSGNLGIDPAKESSELAMHLEHATFLRAAGGRTLQIIDERPKRALVAADYARLGKLLTAVGRRTAELGVETVYHHHMNSIGEKPHELDAVLETVDPKAVGILFDIAHYQQGGGDPVAAIRKYRDRIKVVHLKDVRAIDKAPGYEWVELGPQERRTLHLDKGDILVVYSDGLTDAQNHREEMFGEERLRSIIRQQGPSGSRKLEQNFLSAMEEFTQGMPQTDDITFMVVEKR